MLRPRATSLQSTGFEADAVRMSRRLTFALLTAAFLLAAPAAANAQAPDERANAQALAGIAIRLGEEVLAVSDIPPTTPACLDERRLERRLARVSPRRAASLAALISVQQLGEFARTAAPAFARALIEMHAVPTADRHLRGGRTAWRRIDRVYASFGAVPVVDLCAEARTLARTGRRTPAMRRAARTLDAAMHAGGIKRRLGRAVARLKQLGVPAAQADLFDGPFED
jgi:hypothetical protein